MYSVSEQYNSVEMFALFYFGFDLNIRKVVYKIIKIIEKIK